MKKMNKATPNQRLIHERIRHGWSQQNLADHVGTTPTNVSRWERGVTTPNPYFRQQLVTLFGKSLEDLGLLSPLPQSPAHAPPETVEQADPQSSLINNENEEEQQDVASSLPDPEVSVAFSRFDEGEVVPASAYKSFAFLRPSIFSRQPFAFRVVTLTSLTLLLVIIGLLWFNTGHLTPIEQGKATASPISAPSSSLTNEPVPAFYQVTGSSQLFSDDSLNNDVTQAGWNITAPSNPMGCHIISGAYDMKEFDNQYCLANNTSSITDFVFQITMTLVKGPHAGIVFRVNDNQILFYYFGIDAHGRYRAYYSTTSPDTRDPTIASGYSSAIHQGYNQPNVLGVKAIGSDISLYINSQLVAHIHDSTYVEGNLGVKVVIRDGYITPILGETEATYRDAKVWLL